MVSNYLDPDGMKLSDQIEKKIEKLIDAKNKTTYKSEIVRES